MVRLSTARILNRIAPDAITNSKAVPVIIELLNNPNDQIAYRAAELLGEMRKDSFLAVPALVHAATGTNVLVATVALNSLTKFPEQSQVIVPVLVKILEQTTGTFRWSAAEALNRIDPAAAAKAGMK